MRETGAPVDVLLLPVTAKALRKLVTREGIPVQRFEAAPNRINLVARLKGNGKKRPLLLMGHTDVVTVDPKKWSFPAFSATVTEAMCTRAVRWTTSLPVRSFLLGRGGEPGSRTLSRWSSGSVSLGDRLGPFESGEGAPGAVGKYFATYEE